MAISYCSKLGIIGVIIVCASGCHRKNEIPLSKASSTDIVLLQRAEDPKVPLSQRLRLASEADSLAVLKNDSHARLQSSECIASIYLEMDSLESAKAGFLKSAKLARRLGDFRGEGIDLSNVGLVYHEQGAHVSALRYYIRAVQAFRSIQDTLRTAQGLVDVSLEYKNQGYFEQAFNSSLEAARLLESIGTKNTKVELASIYTTLGNILKELNRLDDALAYHTRAMKLQSEALDSIGLAGSLNNIGNVYRDKKQYRDALKCYTQALQLKEKLGRTKSAATTLNNIAETYLELRKYDNAKLYFLKALELGKDLDKDHFITTANRLSNLYLQERDYQKAESTAMQALYASPSTGLLRQRLENKMILAEINTQRNQPATALAYIRDAMILKDSLFNSEMADAISKMNTRFKTHELEQDLKLSRQQEETQSIRIRNQKIFITLLVTTLILLSVISVLLYQTNEWRKRAKERTETLMAELNHRIKNNLQLITDMLGLQMSMAKGKDQTSTLQGSIDRIQSIYAIHELLYRKGYNGTIEIKDFLESLIQNLSKTYEDKSRYFSTRIDIENVRLTTDSAISLGLIINELLTNLYKHAPISVHHPHLEIRLSDEGNNCMLQISDSCGYWDILKMREAQNGFGLSLVDTLVQQLQGTWEIKSNDYGSVQTIVFNKNL